MKKILITFLFFFLCWYSITGLCYAENTATPPATQPFSLPFKFDVNTLWDLQHKTITLGGSADFISVYDFLYFGIEGVGATEGDFFAQGLLGGQTNIDVNNGVTLLAQKLNLGDKIKWLQGKYFPRIGYCVTYNLLKNSYYKNWNQFITMRIMSF